MLFRLLASSAIAVAIGATANSAFALEDSSKTYLRWQVNYDGQGRYNGCIAFADEGKKTSAVWYPKEDAAFGFTEELCRTLVGFGKQEVES